MQIRASDKMADICTVIGKRFDIPCSHLRILILRGDENANLYALNKLYPSRSLSLPWMNLTTEYRSFQDMCFDMDDGDMMVVQDCEEILRAITDMEQALINSLPSTITDQLSSRTFDSGSSKKTASTPLSVEVPRAPSPTYPMSSVTSYQMHHSDVTLNASNSKGIKIRRHRDYDHKLVQQQEITYSSKELRNSSTHDLDYKDQSNAYFPLDGSEDSATKSKFSENFVFKNSDENREWQTVRALFEDP